MLDELNGRCSTCSPGLIVRSSDFRISFSLIDVYGPGWQDDSGTDRSVSYRRRIYFCLDVCLSRYGPRYGSPSHKQNFLIINVEHIVTDSAVIAIAVAVLGNIF